MGCASAARKKSASHKESPGRSPGPARVRPQFAYATLPESGIWLGLV